LSWEISLDHLDRPKILLGNRGWQEIPTTRQSWSDELVARRWRKGCQVRQILKNGEVNNKFSPRTSREEYRSASTLMTHWDLCWTCYVQNCVIPTLLWCKYVVICYSSHNKFIHSPAWK
jgi:hypothetical protein